jgi:hypothetical protein
MGYLPPFTVDAGYKGFDVRPGVERRPRGSLYKKHQRFRPTALASAGWSVAGS